MHKLADRKSLNIIGTPRLMQSKDIPQVYSLYKKMQDKFNFTFKWSQDEMAHYLMPREGIIYTLVVENTDQKTITDFISFYNLPNQILKQVGHNYTNMNVSPHLSLTKCTDRLPLPLLALGVELPGRASPIRPPVCQGRLSRWNDVRRIHMSEHSQQYEVPRGAEIRTWRRPAELLHVQLSA